MSEAADDLLQFRLPFRYEFAEGPRLDPQLVAEAVLGYASLLREIHRALTENHPFFAGTQVEIEFIELRPGSMENSLGYRITGKTKADLLDVVEEGSRDLGIHTLADRIFTFKKTVALVVIAAVLAAGLGLSTAAILLVPFKKLPTTDKEPPGREGDRVRRLESALMRIEEAQEAAGATPAQVQRLRRKVVTSHRIAKPLNQVIAPAKSVGAGISIADSGTETVPPTVVQSLGTAVEPATEVPGDSTLDAAFLDVRATDADKPGNWAARIPMIGGQRCPLKINENINVARLIGVVAMTGRVRVSWKIGKGGEIEPHRFELLTLTEKFQDASWKTKVPAGLRTEDPSCIPTGAAKKLKAETAPPLFATAAGEVTPSAPGSPEPADNVSELPSDASESTVAQPTESGSVHSWGDMLLEVTKEDDERELEGFASN